jgi:hypothetical protein
MADYELFDITGLAFDPRENSGAKAKNAIDKSYAELSGLLASATQELEKNEIRRKLEILNKAKTTYLVAGKLTSDYTALAEARKKVEIERLKASIKLFKLSGIAEVTTGTIQAQRQATRLADKTIRETFASEGLRIAAINIASDMPKFPTNSETTDKELLGLRQAKDLNPATLCFNLYALAAYLQGKPDQEQAYRAKSTSDLKEIFNETATKVAARNDDFGKLLQSLSSAAKTYVFLSEDTRHDYDVFLKYKKMSDLYETIRLVPKVILLDQRFSEMCVKQIMDGGFSDKEALAIYNKEARLVADPYIPAKATFLAKCPHCSFISEYESEGKAKEKNMCSNCGKPIYKICASCNKLVLASLSKCPECGFICANSGYFKACIAAAELSIANRNFDAAIKHLKEAETLNPNESAKVQAIKTKIKTEQEKLEAKTQAEAENQKKLLEPLRQLIKSRQYQAAYDLLLVCKTSYGFKAPELERDIKAVLDSVNASYKNALPPSKADKCVEILQECADYGPAIACLKAAAPHKCTGLSVYVDNAGSQVAISWTKPKELGVTCFLVRKKGRLPVANVKDGITLLEDSLETSFNDKSLAPGILYTYAVFAKRYGVYSVGSEVYAAVFPEVADARVEQVGSAISISWKLPKNSLYAQVARANGKGLPKTIAGNAQDCCVDVDFNFGERYAYKIKAVYSNNGMSDGVNADILPLPIVGQFTIGENKIRENEYMISWSLTNKGTSIMVLVDGQNKRTVMSEAGYVELKFQPNEVHIVSARAQSGQSWVESANTLTIDTCNPCVIDKAASTFNEFLGSDGFTAEFGVKISGPIPPGVTGFSYGINTIPKPIIQSRISRQDYEAAGEIKLSFTAGQEKEYFFYLYTIFMSNGNEILSKQRVQKFERQDTLAVRWSANARAHWLILQAIGTKPITGIPGLGLYVSTDKNELHSPRDYNASKVLDIGPYTYITRQSEMTVKTEIVDIKSVLKFMKRKKLYLFFNSEPPITSKFITVWDNGFTGMI